MRPRSDGTSLIAVYHFISAAVASLGLCLLAFTPVFVSMAAQSAREPDAQFPLTLAWLAAICGGLFVVVLIVANVIVGWGLWNQREWARLAAIVLAVFRLFNVPLGTIVGALIIYYLLRDDVRQEFTP